MHNIEKRIYNKKKVTRKSDFNYFKNLLTILIKPVLRPRMGNQTLLLCVNG